MIKLILLFFISLILCCTSDDIFRAEKEDFFNMYKNILIRAPSKIVKENSLPKINNNSRWLSKFKQPIILISSEDKQVQATLVALGNNKEKLTWVSADGISLTFDNGILIATRGYKQDLIALKHPSIRTVFKNTSKNYIKIHRYINGENYYDDIQFNCSMTKQINFNLQILEHKLLADKFTELCKNKIHSYTNEYFLLPATNIVLKSKQWISPVNRSFHSYNYYAFQQY
tara:strand:- start:129 stop:815 length:687 start_codon:yes stop_codon:yes gene_type:complete